MNRPHDYDDDRDEDASSKSVITDAEITAWKQLGAPDHRCSYEAWMDFFNRALATITFLTSDLQRTREALEQAAWHLGTDYDRARLPERARWKTSCTEAADMIRDALLTPPTGT
jgi:hypothetical protein